MNELDKELRLSLIEGWKTALRIAAMDLESTKLELEATRAKLAMLEGKLALHRARADYAALALAKLGVKQL